MRRLTSLVLAGAIALVLAAGAAWAATIQCPPSAGGEPCLGTTGADTVIGTPDADDIRALAGPDTVRSKAEGDVSQGGKGEDLVRGAGGDDALVFGGEAGPDPLSGEPGPFTDASPDEARGGRGDDDVYGGYAQGGQDRVFGGEGDDQMQTFQRGTVGDLGVKVTKEFVECGPGVDTAIFDEGLDVVADDCEDLIPVPPGGPTALREGAEGVPELPFE